MTASLLHKEPRIGAPRDDFKFLGHVIDCACFVSFLFFLSGNCQTALGGSCNVSLFTHVELQCFSNLVVDCQQGSFRQEGSGFSWPRLPQGVTMPLRELWGHVACRQSGPS